MSYVPPRIDVRCPNCGGRNYTMQSHYYCYDCEERWQPRYRSTPTKVILQLVGPRDLPWPKA